MLQLLLFVAAVWSAWAANPDPRLTKFQTVEYDTSALVEKISHALYSSEHLYGWEIRSRLNNSCLDANWRNLALNSALHGVYTPFPNAACGREFITQKWRLVDGRLMVARRDSSRAKKYGEPCLDCENSSPDCILRVQDCGQDDPDQYFFVRIHDDQANFFTKQLYFSIHSKLHPDNCLTNYFNVAENGEMFRLQACTGAWNQSFYLSEFDFSANVADIFIHTQHGG